MKVRENASRLSAKIVVLAVLMLGALLLAPLAASAQTDINNDGIEDPLEYPGPFGNDPADDGASDDTTDDDTPEDEVLARTAFQDTSSENHDAEDIDVSIDDVSRHIGNSFVAPDIQPSSDPATGGTGGGLAVTGSDIEPILAISVGLMAVGGSVLVSSRRRLRDIFF